MYIGGIILFLSLQFFKTKCEEIIQRIKEKLGDLKYRQLKTLLFVHSPYYC
jgi:hypothetical protein